METKCTEDQTIELSDDEDEAKTMCIKSEDVRNDEERIVKLEETKSEISTRSGNISKILNCLRFQNILEERECNDIEYHEQCDS